MSKISKKQPVKPSRPITDFFTRKGSANAGPSSSQPRSTRSSSAVGSSSQQSKQSQVSTGSISTATRVTRSTRNPTLQPEQEIISVSSTSETRSHISVSSGAISVSSGTSSAITISTDATSASSGPKPRSKIPTDAVETMTSPPRRSTRLVATKKTQLLSPPPMNPSMKRSHSPDTNTATTFVSSPLKQSKKPLSGSSKRKKVFESDSDIIPLASVVYVSKPSVRPKATAAASSDDIHPPIIDPHSLPLASKENLTCKSPENNLHKKPRISSPLPPTRADSEVEELVPSSQSDEQDIEPTTSRLPADPLAIIESVDVWRNRTALPSSPDTLFSKNADTDVDMDAEISLGIDGDNRSSPLDSSEVEVTHILAQASRSTSVSLLPTSISDSRPPTPPPSSPMASAPINLTGAPSTPVPLTAEEKTAQIIAKIKADALRNSITSSPEPNMGDIPDELVSSSDEDSDNDLWSLQRAKDKGKGPAVATYRTKTQPSLACGGYNLRGIASPMSPLTSSSSASPSPSRSSRSSIGATSITSGGGRRTTRQVVAPRRGPVVLTKGKEKARTVTASDPFEKLLREKRLADKRGIGSDALRLAEDAVAGKSSLQLEMEGEDDGFLPTDWRNEEAALMAIRGRDKSPKSSSPVAEGDGVDEVMAMDEEAREKLFGKKAGKAIVGILLGDREKELEKENSHEKVLGVEFWNDVDPVKHEDRMEVDGATTSRGGLSFENIDDGGHPVVALLKRALLGHDDMQTSSILDSGILSTIDLSRFAGVIPCLSELALSIYDTPLGTSAFRALLRIWDDEDPHRTTSGIPLTLTLAVLQRLGAKTSLLNLLDTKVSTSGVCPEHVDPDRRSDILYRLVVLLTQSARAGAISNGDIPDILSILLWIAIEPSTSMDLKRELSVSIDVICQSILPDNSVVTDVESAICTQLLKLASTLLPINKAHFMSFLAGGSRRTTRIASWVAHSIITGLEAVSSDVYSNLPPLLSLIEPLSAASPPDPIRIFEIHNKTDYEDIGFYVDVLSVALSDIDSYVLEERRMTALEARVAPEVPPSPGNPTPEKAETSLELVRRAIESLHSRIVDTRAAHLDRSRTKASLKRLSMKIFYQRNAALKLGHGSGKPRNIKAYFGAKPRI